MKHFLILIIAATLTACDQSKTDPASAETTPPESPVPVPEGMAYIPPTTYLRGNDKDPGNLKVFLEGITNPIERATISKNHFIEEKPAHKATVNGFFIDKTEVTNAEFKKFTDATGYVTFAEKGVSPEHAEKYFPTATAEMLAAGANVFLQPEQPVNPRRTNNAWRWWAFTPGANWRQPQGPGSSIEDKMDHPVTCVNYDDAAAYAKWAGKRLPTEAEWEAAARAGHEQRMFIWGDSIKKDGKWMANVFQGDFPNDAKPLDGYILTAPVKSYPPNDYGLYDMAGNVWEICSDYYDPTHYSTFIDKTAENPTGPEKPLTTVEHQQWESTGTMPPSNPDSSPLTHLRVSRGGSFLCHYSYCLRFRPAARHYHEPLTPSHHTGFRCAQDLPDPKS